jgi:hypothetical protein
MTIDQTANARYGRIILGLYAALNAVLLVGVSAVLWYFNARAHSHGISPNAQLGFRTQHTLASLHGWYVAQRAGFHFAAVAATVITVIVLAFIAIAAVRRLNPWWILLVPALGGVAVGVCLVVAGHRADAAAVSVEMPSQSGSASYGTSSGSGSQSPTM